MRVADTSSGCACRPPRRRAGPFGGLRLGELELPPRLRPARVNLVRLRLAAALASRACSGPGWRGPLPRAARAGRVDRSGSVRRARAARARAPRPDRRRAVRAAPRPERCALPPVAARARGAARGARCAASSEAPSSARCAAPRDRSARSRQLHTRQASRGERAERPPSVPSRGRARIRLRLGRVRRAVRRRARTHLERQRRRGRDFVPAPLGIEVGHAQLRDLDPALPVGDDLVGELAAHGELDAGVELEPGPSRGKSSTPARSGAPVRGSRASHRLASPRSVTSRRALPPSESWRGRAATSTASAPTRPLKPGGRPSSGSDITRTRVAATLASSGGPKERAQRRPAPAITSSPERSGKSARSSTRAMYSTPSSLTPPMSGCPGSHSARNPGKEGGSSHSTPVTYGRRRISSRHTSCCPGKPSGGTTCARARQAGARSPGAGSPLAPGPARGSAASIDATTLPRVTKPGPPRAPPRRPRRCGR